MNHLEANIFPIANLKDLTTRYRTYRLRGLNHASPDYFKNRDLIVRRLASPLKAPVEIYEMGEESFLAVPENAPELPDTLMMVRTSVCLDPVPGIQVLDYASRSPETDRLCTRFINFMVQGPLYSKLALWQPHSGGAFYEKTPAVVTGGIGLYEGFTVRSVITEDGGIGLCVDVASCFVDQRPLPARIGRQEFRKLKGRHAVYRFGHQWYDIALFERHDLKVNEYRFPVNGKIVSLAEHIETQSRKPIPPELAKLDPEGAVVVYLDRRNDERGAPAALCYLTHDTESREVRGSHRQTIMRPHVRHAKIVDVCRRHLGDIKIGDATLRLSTEPVRIRCEIFPVPDLLFGNGARLSVHGTKGARTVPLPNFGRARAESLSDPGAGFFSRSRLDRQYLLLPKTVADSWGPRFFEDLVAAVKALYPYGGYAPVPVVYNEMIRILTEAGFAWPKSIASEWLSWFDADAGRWRKIWSPVRVSAMLLKLYLPLRTFQIRMLDSGEADSERYVDEQWVENVGPLAPGQRALVRKGFLRKFTDRLTGRVHTGFFVNTNKTQDRGKDEDDKGYEIPWQHGDAIRIVTDLLRWQERYNPIRTPTAWADLHDATIIRTGRSGEFAKRGEACFLFRDPCGTYRNEPLTDSRLRPFWIALLNELERRVAARGEVLADGSPIVFIDKRHPKSGEPLRSVYDLHTLRVSLITALATEGGVPIPILSKCVAGHASILMTLYYVKLGVPQITELLAEAQKKIHVEEQRNFLRFLQSAQHKKLASVVASNDASGVTAPRENSLGSWVVSDKGICPVGGSLCNKGGPKLTPNVQLSDYAPTPGGPRNCVRCRFFITGPAFLGGLVAHFNAIGVQLLAASERFRAKEATIRKLEDELTAMEGQEISPSRMAELHAAYDYRDRDMLEVDELSHNLHAVYRLTERCRAIIAKAKESTSNGQVNLVLAGDQADLEAAIEMTTDFELMNAVCQVAKVYPGNDSTLANLRRARILDAMLARNGRRPVFSALSEDEALAIGNEFVNLLIMRLGHADTVSREADAGFNRHYE